MNTDFKDILSNSNKDIDNQKLMDYLSHKLSKVESHDVEEEMTDDDFLNDAVEGLQQIDNKKTMLAYVEQLNKDLQKQTAKNKKRKEKRRLKDDPYTYITIIIILVLAVIGFFILKKRMEEKRISNQPTVTQVENNAAR